MKKRLCLTLVILMFMLSCGGVINVFAVDANDSYYLGESTSDVDVYNEPVEDLDNSYTRNGIGGGTGQYVPSNTVFLEDNYAAYYFSQLKENFGYNHKGTCSYVATAMLLSYYDTYWDDSIIERTVNGVTNEDWDKVQDGFDVSKSIKENTQSPGVKNDETIVNNEKTRLGLGTNDILTDSDYDVLITPNSNQYFHFELLRLGKYVLGMDYALYPWDVVDLLEYYLYNIRGYTASQVPIEYKNWADFEGNKRDYIIDKVVKGIPVLVCGGNIDISEPWFHTYIIYDYDEANDELYCHLGWVKDKYYPYKEYTHIAFSSIDGTLIGGAITLDFRTEHSCSNNYTYVEDGETKSKCSCYFPCHDAHTHEYGLSEDGSQHTYVCGCHVNDSNYYDHTFEYTSVDSDAHMLVCSECEYSYTAEHNMRYKMYADLGKHGYKCVDCGYVDEDSLEAHSYNYWAYLNPTTHISECTCGARGTTTAPHAFVAPDIFSLERVCVGCGYTKIAGSDIGQIILSIQKVSLNGSYILPDGNIVLVDEDVEAYLNGTLVFYDKDNLPVTQ